MKKLRRFLTVLLFINFSWGMATGMEPLNFWLVMANGTAVIGLAVDEMEDSYWEDGDGWCYGNYLSDKMIKAGISFDVYYADSEE